MARRDLTHKELLAEWMDFETMIPKKCSDAQTMWKMIVEQKDFCKKTWEEQMRIKEEEASILFTKYNDSWDKGYQDSYPCKQPDWPCSDSRPSAMTDLQKKLLDCVWDTLFFHDFNSE